VQVNLYNLIFFTNILRILEERGLTKHELSEKAQVSISFLSDLTNGKANPSLKIMEAISEALGISLPALLESTDLKREDLETLAGKKITSSTSTGLVRVSAILTEHQAFIVKKWDEQNREKNKGKI
jgi:transcriptional regulator with XRE-family HTH domain